ncbi:hypothetical protein [Aestuariicoccus sp. MJ-SS9]|uniref:hypothetical protein n=1 Tax=Aestuariicoccus sp. MJ-SS9 TaxID=3079855 RepID=UPI00290D468D|nr:hypothetical protein [Aestuariicoccus sp. MJ-SS9]MDU8910525.1 hypothetical protein [Aestuariicoccus sp. MJ-SS9]
MRLLIALLPALFLAACGEGFLKSILSPPTGAEGQTRPEARPDGMAARRPPETARTVEEFDTTTAAERAEAAAVPVPAGERRLGVTVASLGDVTAPGFWLETPLVTEPAKGRIVYQGKSAQVDLIPIQGATTAGSRISLAAMRLIGAPLTDLPEIEVFAGG